MILMLTGGGSDMKDCKSLAECIAEVVTRMSGQNEGAVELQTAEDDPAVRQFYYFLHRSR